MNQHNYLFAVNRTIAISLFFLFACVPLIVNPFTQDFWYKPKIDAICVLIVIITLAGAIRHFLLKVPFHYKPVPVFIPLLAFAGSALLSTLFSTAPHLSLFGDFMREESISTLLTYAALTFLFSQLVATEKQFHSLMKGLIFSSVVISLNGIANYWGYYPIQQLVPFKGYLGPGVGSTIGNPNFLGKYLVLILPLCMAYYCTSKDRVETVCYAAGLLACLTALVLTFTRASWLAFFVAIIIYFLLTGRDLFRKDGKKIACTLFVIVVMLSMFFWVGVPNQEKNFFDLARKKLSTSFDFGEGRGVANRLFVWKKTIDYAEIEEIRGLKKRIDSTFTRDDIKRGYGGIREAEFFIQTFQLLYAGENKSLKSYRILNAIQALKWMKMVPEKDLTVLWNNYLYLRRVEHYLQMKEDLQTHTLP